MPAAIHEPRTLAPRAGAIHVWHVDLAQPDDRVATLRALLSSDERARADRFVFAHDRRRFVVTRACLRAVLARCGDTPAADIRFAYGPHGKPSLGPGGVHFNVSHSGEIALIAVAPDVPLGVDVEIVRPLPDLLELASRYFSAAEGRTIAAMPAADRALAFFLCWTRKEAFVKARGDGLSVPLDRHSVTCTPGEAPRLVEIDGSVTEAARWTVVDLAPAPGYAGALVVRAGARPLRFGPRDVERILQPATRDTR